MPAHIDDIARTDERQNAFNFVRAELELFREEIDISSEESLFTFSILHNMNNFVLCAQEGDETEVGNINSQIREKIFIIQHYRTSLKNKFPSTRLTTILMILATYWPLNVYKYNADTNTSHFECPLSKEELNAENKIIFPSGTQFSKSISAAYYADGMKKGKNGFIDMVTTKELTDDDKEYWIAQDKQMLREYYASDDYKEYKSEALAKAFERAIAHFIIVTGIIFMLATATIVILNLAAPILALIISAAAMASPFIALTTGLVGYLLKRHSLRKEEKASLAIHTYGIDNFKALIQTFKDLPPSYNNSNNVINHALDIQPEPSATAYVEEEDQHHNILQEDRRRGRLAWLDKVEKKIKPSSDQQVQQASRALN